MIQLVAKKFNVSPTRLLEMRDQMDQMYPRG